LRGHIDLVTVAEERSFLGRLDIFGKAVLHEAVELQRKCRRRRRWGNYRVIRWTGPGWKALGKSMNKFKKTPRSAVSLHSLHPGQQTRLQLWVGLRRIAPARALFRFRPRCSDRLRSQSEIPVNRKRRQQYQRNE